MRSRRLWLCVAPTVLCLVDCVLIRGTTRHPDLLAVLAVHPLVPVLLTVLWISLFSLALVFLPLRPAKALALAVTLGHGLSAGALSGLGHLAWGSAILFLLSAVLIVATWEKAGAEPEGAAAPPALVPAGRFRRLLLVSLAASLAAIALLEAISFRRLQAERTHRRKLAAELAGYGPAAREVDEYRRLKSVLEPKLQIIEDLRRYASPSGAFTAIAVLDGGIIVREARIAHGDLLVQGVVDGDRTADKLRGLLSSWFQTEVEVSSPRRADSDPEAHRFPGGDFELNLRAAVGKGFSERRGPAK